MWLVGGLKAGEGRGFGSFKAFKRMFGRAGDGIEWHHIVEQTPGNIARFGEEAIHNSRNMALVIQRVHWKINRYYSGKDYFTGEAQFSFGLDVMRLVGAIP